MLNSISSIMLVSGLAFMGTAPFVADYVVLAAGLFGLALAVLGHDAMLKAWPTRLLLLSLVLIGLTIPFVYKTEADLVPLLAFAPLVLAPGIAVLVRRSPEWLSPYAFAATCLTGVVAALLVGLAEYSSNGGLRVGAGNNPIHYGGIATIVGFLALTGAVAGRSPIRLLFLLGPLAGLAAVLLSGSRGPLLAWIALCVFAVPLIAWWNRRDRFFLAALSLVVVAGIAMAVVADGNRAVDLFDAATHTAAGESAESVALVTQRDGIRVAMNLAALEALKSSPVFGVGFGQMMPFAYELYPEFDELTTLENLHSDIGNFSAMAGILGLIAYGAIMLAPLSLLLPAASRHNRPLILGAVMLVVGYGALGLTNAMIGVLPQTALFVLALGYLMALQRSSSTI